jgi:hypothetical protein
MKITKKQSKYILLIFYIQLKRYYEQYIIFLIEARFDDLKIAESSTQNNSAVNPGIIKIMETEKVVEAAFTALGLAEATQSSMTLND